MASSPQLHQSRLVCILLILSLLLRDADGAAKRPKTSIVFATLGRSHYSFDLFSLPVPQLSTTDSSSSDEASLRETRLTDGHSVNYNGFFPPDPPALLSLLKRSSSDSATATPLDGVVYVSERNGTSNLYLDVFTQIPSTSLSAVLQLPARLQLPLLQLPPTSDGSSFSVSLKDRPSITGHYVVYVSTHEDPHQPRKSWAAVYSTQIQTGVTRRLTPRGIADFSPAVSPDGLWTAVASSGEQGWTGEVQELNTGIYVFRTKDGSNRSKVVERGGWPSWAPDGSALYFHRESEDGWWSVYRAAIDATTSGIVVTSIERLTPPGFHAFTPAAGRGFVALATRRPGSEFRHMELLDLSTETFVELTKQVSPNSNHYNPFVSPDSARVGYHRCRGTANAGVNPLLFESINSPEPDISLFRVDGSYPSFSPDGKRVAYVGLPGLYVVDPDGRHKREIFKGSAFPSAWDWKRKGVIYTSHGPTFAGERTEVDVISITLPDDATATPAIKKLSIGGANNAFPSPSPDGKWVVFRSGRSGHKNLYIMDAVEGESAGIRRLTEGNWTDTMCNWSPNGEWIAFASDRDNPGGGGFAVYFVRPDGTGLHKVVQSAEGGRVNHPFFSPDSKRFVFTTDYAAVSAEPIANPHHYQPYGDIFIAKVDGSEIRRLTHNSYEDGTPTWGPVFMEPKDVVESPPTAAGCRFEDCQWLGKKKMNFGHEFPAARGCRAA